jgi:hypothetical protein
MPFTMEFIDHGRGIQFHRLGEPHGRGDDRLQAPPARRRVEGASLRFAIVSLVDVQHFDITPTEVHKLAALDRQIGQLTPVVAVVVIAPRTHDFGMARMWETILDVPGWSASVVRTREEADAWLAPRIAAAASESSGRSPA